jgi:excisionase family DNA binding protein
MATKDMKLTPDVRVMKASKAVGVKLRKSLDKAASGGAFEGRKAQRGSLKGAKTFRMTVSTAKRARGGKDAEVRQKRGVARRVYVKDLELTEELAEAFYAVASGLAAGHTVVVGTAADDLTTTQAAAELGMSRPTLISLLQAGELDYHMVGSHRRIPRSEVVRYKEAGDVKAPAQDEERRSALRRMTKISSEAGEGY